MYLKLHKNNSSMCDVKSALNYSSDFKLNTWNLRVFTARITCVWLTFKVDLGEVRSVYSVATQGYRSSTYYTLSYKLQYSTDGNSFHDVIGSNGSAKVKDVHKVVSGYFIINVLLYSVAFVLIFRTFSGAAAMTPWLNITFPALLAQGSSGLYL